MIPGQEPRVPDVVLLDQQRDFLWFRLTEARAGMSVQDVDRMRRVNERFMPPPAMLRYAVAAGLNGQQSQARRNLQLLCQMWTRRNCEEGRASWGALQARFPQLRTIDFPEPAAPAR
jgi:hypothetical protein